MNPGLHWYDQKADIWFFEQIPNTQPHINAEAAFEAKRRNSGTSFSIFIPSGIGLSISPIWLINSMTSGWDQTANNSSNSVSVDSLRNTFLKALDLFWLLLMLVIVEFKSFMVVGLKLLFVTTSINFGSIKSTWSKPFPIPPPVVGLHSPAASPNTAIRLMTGSVSYTHLTLPTILLV